MLWRAGRHAYTRTPVGDHLPAALIKLFVHPHWPAGACPELRATGVDVPAVGLTMLVLAAALPNASNVSLLAERYAADADADDPRIIMTSTVLASAGFAPIAWFAHP